MIKKTSTRDTKRLAKTPKKRAKKPNTIDWNAPPSATMLSYVSNAMVFLEQLPRQPGTIAVCLHAQREIPGLEFRLVQSRRFNESIRFDARFLKPAAYRRSFVKALASELQNHFIEHRRVCMITDDGPERLAIINPWVARADDGTLIDVRYVKHHGFAGSPGRKLSYSRALCDFWETMSRLFGQVETTRQLALFGQVGTTRQLAQSSRVGKSMQNADEGNAKARSPCIDGG